jgi:flagellar protein FliL
MAQRDPETAEHADSVKTRRYSLIKLAILVVLLVLLGGGGYLGYAKFLKHPPVESSQAAEDQSAAQDLGSFLVNLSDPGGKRYLKVALQLELSSPKASQELNRRSVEVRDIILTILSSKEYSEIGSASGKMMLKRELLTKLNKTLRDGQVKEIYFTEFLVQ